MATHPISKPTFYPDIFSLFNQWDRVQMLYNSLAPKLPYGDPKAAKLDLWDYDSVKKNATSILTQLMIPAPTTGGSLFYGMPYYIGPWSQGKIDTFHNWINSGMLEGTPPEVPTVSLKKLPTAGSLTTFLKLSELLTGFDNLTACIQQINAPAHLPAIYLYRLQNESTGADGLDDLLSTFKTLSGDNPDGIPEDTLEGKITTPYKTLVNDIVTLWYGGYIMKNFKTDYGPPSFNQYQYGLLWINAGAHVMGYAEYADNTKNNPPLTTTTNGPAPTGKPSFYWADAPAQKDSTTGFFTENTGY